MKQRIKLTHSSNHPGAEGEPGDVIECEIDIAAQFLAGRGAVVVDEVAEPKKTRKRRAKNGDSRNVQSDERAGD